MSITTFELTDSWRGWISENYLLGTAADKIVAVLVAQGMSPDVALTAVERVRRDPHLVPATWIAQRLLKLESMLDAQQRARQLDGGHATVPRREQLSGPEFLRDYYAPNRPVVLAGFAKHWPALNRWTPTFMSERLGNEVIEVMTGREDDRRYEEHLDAHRSEMSFRDYVTRVESAGPTNDFYLVANNHFFERPGVGPMLEDVVYDDQILDASSAPGQMFFWYGPAGTVTPLHHDTSNVLLTQVRGRKRVTLVPALESHRVYNDVAVYSAVDAESPDLGRHPRYAGVTSMTVTLAAGDALFIPVGWWHHVRGLDVSISVSFTNFAFPNTFDWTFPRIERS